MIEIYNGPRLIQDLFFKELINYLDQQEGLILRQIKKDFPQQVKLDKSLETYIEAGYIKRDNRRYYNNFNLLTAADLADLSLDQLVFVQTDSPLFKDLQQLTFEQVLTNASNEAKIIEQVAFTRADLSLTSYFYRLQNQLPLSQQQQGLYQLLGDVNEAYAMKYLTNFLLKFGKKDLVMQKRTDIFVSALLVLGYIEPSQEAFKYRLAMDFDADTLTFKQR